MYWFYGILNSAYRSDWISLFPSWFCPWMAHLRSDATCRCTSWCAQAVLPIIFEIELLPFHFILLMVPTGIRHHHHLHACHHPSSSSTWCTPMQTWLESTNAISSMMNQPPWNAYWPYPIHHSSSPTTSSESSISPHMSMLQAMIAQTLRNSPSSWWITSLIIPQQSSYSTIYLPNKSFNQSNEQIVDQPNQVNSDSPHGMHQSYHMILTSWFATPVLILFLIPKQHCNLIQPHSMVCPCMEYLYRISHQGTSQLILS